MVEATFVRRRGSRDRVYVTRSDGTSTSWDFPSYGDGLPHDLCHLVVEDALGLQDGFWGLVDQGVDVRLVDNEPTLTRDRRPLTEHADIDFSGLREAESAVGLLAGPSAAGGGDLPAGASEEAAAAVDRRLRALAERWSDLDDGGAITLTFSGRGRKRGSPA